MLDAALALPRRRLDSSEADTGLGSQIYKMSSLRIGYPSTKLLQWDVPYLVSAEARTKALTQLYFFSFLLRLTLVLIDCPYPENL